MNKDEKMIEEMAIIISGSTELDTMNYYSARYKAKALIDAGYRKVADDEIVESMKTYERARQETAREILALIGKPNYKGDDWYEGAFYKQEQIREQIADIYGIDLED